MLTGTCKELLVFDHNKVNDFPKTIERNEMRQNTPKQGLTFLLTVNVYGFVTVTK